MGKKEKELIEALLAGDKSAESWFYTKYYWRCDTILRKRYGMVDPKPSTPLEERSNWLSEQRKDIIQESLTRVVKHLPTSKLSLGYLVALHLKGARHDHLKKEVHLPEVDVLYEYKSRLFKIIDSFLTTCKTLRKSATQVSLNQLDLIHRKVTILFFQINRIENKINYYFLQRDTDLEEPRNPNINKPISEIIEDLNVKTVFRDVFDRVFLSFSTYEQFIILDNLKEISYEQLETKYGITIGEVRGIITRFRRAMKAKLPAKEDLL